MPNKRVRDNGEPTDLTKCSFPFSCGSTDRFLIGRDSLHARLQSFPNVDHLARAWPPPSTSDQNVSSIMVPENCGGCAWFSSS